MKKIYSKPEFKAIKIVSAQVMATSPSTQTLNYAGDNDVDGGPTVAETKESSAGVWDNEW